MSFRGAKRRRIQKSLFVCPGSFADAQDDMMHLRFFAALRMTRIYVMCVILRERNDRRIQRFHVFLDSSLRLEWRESMLCVSFRGAKRRRIQKSLFVCPGSFADAQDDMMHLRFFAALRMTRIYVMCVILRERNDRRIQRFHVFLDSSLRLEWRESMLCVSFRGAKRRRIQRFHVFLDSSLRSEWRENT